MFAWIKNLFKQSTCKHEWWDCTKPHPSGYQCLSGERIYIVCKKCGKVQGSYFSENP